MRCTFVGSGRLFTADFAEWSDYAEGTWQWEKASHSICGPGTFESLITLGEAIALRADDPGATHFGPIECECMDWKLE